MKRSAFLATLLVLLVRIPLPGQALTPADSVAARVALGRKLFDGKGLCFSCHGKAGEGVLGPSTRLAGRKLVHVKPVLADVAGLIEAGVDSAHSSIGQPMPPKGGSRLTATEVQAVAEYVLELQNGSAARKP
jgi:mono/diheme cytochrome c family protein